MNNPCHILLKEKIPEKYMKAFNVMYFNGFQEATIINQKIISLKYSNNCKHTE